MHPKTLVGIVKSHRSSASSEQQSKICVLKKKAEITPKICYFATYL
jgi:hypothetical protein